jgi:enamine deaminase RidA (YjgF/YER057c/UK114 family)
VFFSGMVGLNSDGQLVGGADALPREARAVVRSLEEAEARRGFAAQCWASFEQLAAAAKNAGSRLEDLVKMTVYVGDAQDLPIFEAVRSQFLEQSSLPAFECVGVLGPGPVPGALVQIEAIAAI